MPNAEEHIRNAALEEAAKIADAEAMFWGRRVNDVAGAEGMATSFASRCNSAEAIAANIRAQIDLKPVFQTEEAP